GQSMLKMISTLLLMLLAATVQGQSKQAIIKLKNETPLQLTAKLVGPMAKYARLRESETHTFHVQPGEYRLLYEFHVSADTELFLMTDSFSVAENHVLTALANTSIN